MKGAILVLAMAATAMAGERNDFTAAPVIPPGSQVNRFGAIETRPLWERNDVPHESLQRQTERAMERGNGRIDDPALWDLEQMARENALRSSPNPARDEFEQFQRERDRAMEIERRQREQQQQVQQKRVLEVESEKLADERARWWQMQSKPRHAEAAVVDRQLKEATTRETKK